MHIARKRLITLKLIQTSIGIVLGILLWHIAGESHQTFRWISVPVVFYNQTETLNIKCPETVQLCLAGKRKALRRSISDHIAITLDAQSIRPGTYALCPTKYVIGVPDCISVVDCNPMMITISAMDVTV